MTKKIYKEDGNYTDDGQEIAAIIDKELYTIIEKYVDGYNRIEFEHMVLTETPMQFTWYFIKKRLDAKKNEKFLH